MDAWPAAHPGRPTRTARNPHREATAMHARAVRLDRPAALAPRQTLGETAYRRTLACSQILFCLPATLCQRSGLMAVVLL